MYWTTAAGKFYAVNFCHQWSIYDKPRDGNGINQQSMGVVDRETDEDPIHYVLMAACWVDVVSTFYSKLNQAAYFD
jgi:hypothetical protein